MAKKTPAKKPVKPAAKAPSKGAKHGTPLKKPVKAVKKATVKVVAKKPVSKKPDAKTTLKKVVKNAPSKAAGSSSTPAKKTSKAKGSASKTASTKSASSSDRVLAQQFIRKPAASKNKLTPFLTRQRQRLLELKDTLLDSMRGVARDNLHAGSETSAFGMHQADAGSDAYDRDFALSMLSKEQGSLYEIDEALKRIDDGSYGVCDICEKPIRHDRLEALPFTRYTVECQAELEKRQHHHSVRPHINSLFGLTEEETESEEEETAENS